MINAGPMFCHFCEAGCRDWSLRVENGGTHNEYLTGKRNVRGSEIFAVPRLQGANFLGAQDIQFSVSTLICRIWSKLGIGLGPGLMNIHNSARLGVFGGEDHEYRHPGSLSKDGSRSPPEQQQFTQSFGPRGSQDIVQSIYKKIPNGFAHYCILNGEIA
ncbi:hypothetical protein C8F04DRAFT_1203115 [Mycena alexandri]|uniref:Uncharacterized protein n=1 Tax=Mycena alexandri TaxID=1745969 RepID=A0AAD6RWD1_9AGAR|nr:hypothetical protein C8F04DRAFT_1203115 [Mycena alexandri]